MVDSASAQEIEEKCKNKVTGKYDVGCLVHEIGGKIDNFGAELVRSTNRLNAKIDTKIDEVNHRVDLLSTITETRFQESKEVGDQILTELQAQREVGNELLSTSKQVLDEVKRIRNQKPSNNGYQNIPY